MKILKNNLMNYEIEKNKKNKELKKLKEEFEKYKKDNEKEINELKRKIEKYERELKKNNSQKNKTTEEQNLSLIRLKSIYEKPFVNSILQCLIQTMQLSDYFLNNLSNFNNNNQLSSYKYYEIFKNINVKNFEAFDANIFIDDYNNKIESPKDFLLSSLKTLHEELKLKINDNYFNMNQISKSIITDIFQGISKIKKYCSLCGFNYTIDEPFKYILIDEKDFSSISKNEIDINEIYIKWKKKNNSNTYYTKCQNCNNWTCDENFSVHEFPKYLILILERNNENIKINFDEIFNLSCLENENVNNFYLYYKLYGVVTKIKKEDHYIASCVNYKDNLWYKFDDDEISPIKDVKSEVIYYEMPLILFYSKEILG